MEDRRLTLFRETPLEIAQRVALGTAWALRPRRAGKLLPLAQLWLADLIAGEDKLPDHDALKETSEFAGIVHDLSVPTLLAGPLGARGRPETVAGWRAGTPEGADARH